CRGASRPGPPPSGHVPDARETPRLRRASAAAFFHDLADHRGLIIPVRYSGLPNADRYVARALPPSPQPGPSSPRKPESPLANDGLDPRLSPLALAASTLPAANTTSLPLLQTPSSRDCNIMMGRIGKRKRRRARLN